MIDPIINIALASVGLWWLIGAVVFRLYLESVFVARPKVEKLLVWICGAYAWRLAIKMRRMSRARKLPPVGDDLT